MGCFEFDQAVALTKLGHKVSLMSVDRRIILNEGVERKWGISSFVKDGVFVYNIFLFPLPIKSFYWITTFIAMVLGLILYRRVVSEQGKPEILHCHYLFNLPIASYIKRKYNIPIVATEHWSKVHTETTPKYITYLSKYYRYSDAVIAVSESLQKALYSKFGVESKIVYNMLGDDFTKTYYKQTSDNKGYYNLVAVGSLAKEKGFELLLHAIHQCSNIPLQCFIIGEGKDEEEIKSIAYNYELRNVYFLGKKNKREIIDILSISDFFVLPSYKETFGVVYIEAMSQGLPVIGTRCGGPEEFISESNGILIAPGCKSELVDAIHYMTNNLKSYDSDKIRTWCVNNFSSESISYKIVEVYNNVCK